MASSGSYNFATDRDTLIADAHLYIGAIGEGETPSANQVTEAARMLNMIVKLREADGMPLWAIKRGYILPFSGASSINTNSHVVVAYDTTTLGGDEAAAQTALTVASITGFSASDQLGIELDDGSIDWTTINGAPSGTTITATAGLTSAASSGNRVFGYTASSERIQKPLRILHADILQLANNTSHSINVVSEQDYFGLGSRTTEGTPNQIYYSRVPSSDTALETNGTIFVYPRFSAGDHVIEFTYQRPFMDFDASTDEPDFPQAFYLPIVIELAALLGPKFGVPLKERVALFNEAAMYRAEALMTIQPEGSLFLQPDL